MTPEDISERRESRDRLIKVETVVFGIDELLKEHVNDEMHMWESVKADVRDVRETTIKQAMSIEGLVRIVEAQTKAAEKLAMEATRAKQEMEERLEKIAIEHRRVSEESDKRLKSLEMRVYGALLVISVLWTLLGSKIGALLGVA